MQPPAPPTLNEIVWPGAPLGRRFADRTGPRPPQPWTGAALCPPGVGQRLTDLAVVAVDGKGLQPELPALQVDLLDLLDGRRPGMLTVLEMAPDRNGWTAAIMRTWPIGLIARSPIAQSNTGSARA